MKVLSREDYLDSMRDVRKEINPDGPSAVAMYSSLVDGVVTDPELMLLPVDDHMAARGHGVFDMCTLRNGWLYRLAAHLDRLLDSAESAKLEFPYPGGRAENARKMTEVISGTVSACSVRDAPIRYFLSAGPGNFAFGPAGCRTAFYVVVQGKSSIRDLAEGVPEVFVRSVPLKTMPFVKSNNYMINTLVYMSAREQGGSFGLTLDEDGMLVESCNLTPILVVNSTLVTPLSGRGTNALRSVTQLRVFELAEAGALAPGVSAVERRPIAEAEVFAADELFLVGGDTHVFPIVSLDGKPIGAGAAGPVAKSVIRAIEADVAAAPSPNHIRVAYD